MCAGCVLRAGCSRQPASWLLMPQCCPSAAFPALPLSNLSDATLAPLARFSDLPPACEIRRRRGCFYDVTIVMGGAASNLVDTTATPLAGAARRLRLPLRLGRLLTRTERTTIVSALPAVFLPLSSLPSFSGRGLHGDGVVFGSWQRCLEGTQSERFVRYRSATRTHRSLPAAAGLLLAHTFCVKPAVAGRCECAIFRRDAPCTAHGDGGRAGGY